MNLQELQRQLKTQIETKSKLSPEAFPAETLNPQCGEDGRSRLSVYAGGYEARTLEALKEVYEAVRHIIGPKKFGELAQSYANVYPSNNYNLTFYGRHLPEFLKSYSLTNDFPFLPDLALLEWKVCEAFHAFEKTPTHPSELSKIPPDDWEKISFVFQPSVGLVKSSWPVLDLWNARHTPVEQIKIDLVNRPQNALVFREGFHVHGEPVSDLEFKVLEALLSGKSLGEVFDALAGETPEEGLPVTEWFSAWMRRGLLIKFKM